MTMPKGTIISLTKRIDDSQSVKVIALGNIFGIQRVHQIQILVSIAFMQFFPTGISRGRADTRLATAG